MEGHTELIRRWAAGDSSALGALFEASYAELHRLARARLWRDGGVHLLNATALVHETIAPRPAWRAAKSRCMLRFRAMAPHSA